MPESRANYFFETYGPFPIEMKDGVIVRPEALWWDEIDWSVGVDVSRSIGCYMFAMGDKNIKPWYVGKTTNQRGFREEVFTGHKLKHFNWVVSEGYRGPPQIYLFPMITQSFDREWSFCSGNSHDGPVEWLERTLMGMAYSQNPAIANSRDLTYFRSVHVRGLLGQAPRGRRTGHIAKARQALLGEKR